MPARTMLVALALIPALLAFAGCGSDGPAEPENPEPEILEIAGTWSYSENYSSAAAGVSCQNEGIATFSQNGANFTGSVSQQGVCTDSFGNAIDNSGTGSIGGGQIDGNQVSLSAGECDYSGTISGDPPNRMSGSVSCTFAVGGTNYNFTGTWTATR